MKASTLFGTLLPVLLPISAWAENITVTSAQVTEVRSVDEGFKTFVQAPLSAPVTRSVLNGESFTVDVFELFTDEDKVNVEEPPGGDTTAYDITAAVTFGAPLNRTLTFGGDTFGQEDVSVVPAHLQPILAKENPTFQEGLLLAQWGLANPELAKIAGGRGVVTWGPPQVVDLGGGKSVAVKLNDTFYNEGLQFGGAGAGFGTGPGNAGTVTATVTYTEEIVIPELENLSISTVSPVPDGGVLGGMEITWDGQVGYMYDVETSETGREGTWEDVPGLGQLPGVGSLFRRTVPANGRRTLLIRVTASLVDPVD